AGDLFVTFRDPPAIRAFVQFLATAPAAEAWAKSGGFGTGNHNVPASIYPDAITKQSEAPILTAKSVVFDMSDLQPPSFGGTTGQGEWGLFQQFLKNPKDVKGIASKLETAATKAHKKGKKRRGAGGIPAEPPVTVVPPPSAEPGRLGRYLTVAVFLLPAVILLGVWMIYPLVYTIIRSFFGQHGFIGTWV